jgi:hypothetical protein
MWHFDESAAQFPTPRSEEPANLRRQIVDELADHLTCALRREQLAGGAHAQTTAEERVLDRFGDPGKVARKLWFDWMWEKIMSQRILVGLCVLMAVVSCVALGLAWASLSRQQDLIATWQSTSQSQMEEQRQLFERLLAQSEKSIAASAQSKAPSDWNPVEFRFVSGKEDGPPAAGIKVDVSIQASETGIPPMQGTSNEKGVVRFERVRYGRYTVNVHNTAGESLLTRFTLQPGESLTRTIICPDPPTVPAKVTARIAWPEDLREISLWFRFEGNVKRIVAEREWFPPAALIPRESEEGYPPGRELFVSPTGEMVAAYRLLSGVRGGGGRSRGRGGRGLGARSTDLAEVRDVLPNFSAGQGIDPIKELATIDWPGSDYRIPSVEVLRPDGVLTSVEQLRAVVVESRTGGVPPPRSGFARSFNSITLPSADWAYRVEPGESDNPGTLVLTPTQEAIEKLRAALAEIDQYREEAKKAAEQAKARAEAAARRAAKSEAAEDKKSPPEGSKDQPEVGKTEKKSTE